MLKGTENHSHTNQMACQTREPLQRSCGMQHSWDLWILKNVFCSSLHSDSNNVLIAKQQSEKDLVLPHPTQVLQDYEVASWMTAGIRTRHLEKLQVPSANCRSGKHEHNRCILSFKLRRIASSWCQFTFCIFSWNSKPTTALIEWNEGTIWAWHTSCHGNYKIIS